MSPAKMRYRVLTPITDSQNYQELYPGIKSFPLQPTFVLGPLPASIAYLYYSEHDIPSVGVYHLRDVGVSSHGLMVQDGYFVVSKQMNLTSEAILECSRYGDLNAERIPTRVIDEPAVLLAGPGHLIWGHWIVDFLPKLFVLHSAGVPIYNMRYILPSNTPIFAFQLLALLGIKQEQIIQYQPYSETILIRHLIAPSVLRWNSRAHFQLGDAAQFLAECIQARFPVPPMDCERIFVSRSAAGRDHRLLVNRNEIEHKAKLSGFKIVRPEQMPLIEQIRLFYGARQIVGEYGSGLHNSIFSQPGIVICALRADSVHPGFLQSGICQAKKQSVSYVFGASEEVDMTQRFIIESSDFDLALKLLEMYDNES